MNRDDPTIGFQQLMMGGVILVFVVAMGYGAHRNSELMADFGVDPGPAFQPVLMLWLLGAAGVGLSVQGLVRLAQGGWRVTIPLASVRSAIFPLLMVLSLIAYVGLVNVTGFLAVSLMLTVSWAAILVAQDHGLRQIRSLLMGVGGAVLLVIVIYLLFRQVIGVPLN